MPPYSIDYLIESILNSIEKEYKEMIIPDMFYISVHQAYVK